MFSNQYPTFQRGRVLKSTMLENLRDYPRNFTELYFQDYSDGIMTGAMISVDESFLTISKGIVKYNGRLYMLEKDVQLPYIAMGKETLVKIKFHNEQLQPDFIACETTVFLDESQSIQRDELELGRFKLKEGAMLRTKHTDFYDFATEYNTVNYIHCEFAGMETSTLHPLLLRAFAKELLMQEPTNTYDILFAMQCLNEERVQRDVILYYVGNRLGIGYRSLTNGQLHSYLSRILQEVKGGNRAQRGSGYGRAQRVIVD